MSQDLRQKINSLLRDVQHPSQYIGCEWGSVPRAADADFTYCMVYPDVYEVGQPNQALRILVDVVNKESGMYAERAFLPSIDMIDKMRSADIPLFSIDTETPLVHFDAVGITLPHDLCATNVLEVLDLGRIPLLSRDRDGDCPIVFGGGPCTYNPEPYVPFFDALMIGEGEESLVELLRIVRQLREQGVSRENIVAALESVPGTYVPYAWDSHAAGSKEPDGDLQHRGRVIEKRIFEGFAESGYRPTVVPFAETVHDRLNVEILRGCARGCRFCQAGMTSRPVREKSAAAIVEEVREGLAQTGYDEVSLTSLSSTDHSQIEEILNSLNKEFAGSGIRISVPSQRLDAFGTRMAALVAGEKKGGLTFAPEAGTQRLRDAINKNVTEDNLFSAVSAAVSAGWRRAKLYFMVGLPTETDEDVQGIAALANATYELMRRECAGSRGQAVSLGIAISVFVPKAQTPFQWDGQVSPEEALRRIKIVKQGLRHRAIRVSYHDPYSSFIEAVMSRGGREVADVVYAAWRRGARFDAWAEHFDLDAWKSAAKDCDVDMDIIAQRTLDADAVLPWAHISCGVDAAYLLAERERAYACETTQDCTFTSCTQCGVCPNLHTRCRSVVPRTHIQG